MRQEIDFSVVDELLAYDPESGVFTHRVGKPNGVKPGDRAGTTSTQGYIVISVKGKRLKAHRLAWLLMTGAWPVAEIDHKNGDRADNRFSNLRDVPPSVNQQNRQGLARNNTSGFRGVTRTGTRTKPWRAQIKAPGGAVTYLGCFETREEASKAHEKAKELLHPGAVQVISK